MVFGLKLQAARKNTKLKNRCSFAPDTEKSVIFIKGKTQDSKER